jgi:hypothetical protein
MTTDWNKLTVAELRVELRKRSLVQTGKKADLVERLSSYSETGDAEDATAPADEAQPSEPQPTESPAEPESNAPTSQSTDQQLQEPAPTQIEPAVEEPEPSIATELDVAPVATEPDVPAQVEVTATIVSDPPTDTVPPQPQTESKIDMLLDKDEVDNEKIIPIVGEAIQDIQSRKRRSRTPSIDESVVRKRARQGDSDFAAADTEMTSGVESGNFDQPEAAGQGVDQEEAERVSDQNVMEEDKEETKPSIDLEHRSPPQANDTKPQYPADDDTAMEDAQERAGIPGTDGQAGVEAADYYDAGRETAYDTAEADRGADERPVVPAMHPATSALYIKNLMRPLRDAVLEDYLVDLATPPAQQPNPDVIVEFYLDNIKSHAFVQFNSVSAASRVRSSLHDQVWPDERNRKALWVDFIPTEKVRDWIDQEQAAGQGRGNFNRFEVIYEPDHEGNMSARLEELGPEAARQSARPPPTGPAATGIPTGPRGSGIEGAPLGPRGSGGRMGPPYRPQGVTQLEEGWKQTRAYPQLLYRPASEELALRRIDNMRSYYTADKYRDMGKEDEINRYTFESNDSFVDRGREVFIGIRPPHREAERRRGGAPGYGGGRRGPSPRRRGPPPPSSRDVDRYVGGRSSGRDDFTPRSRFNGAPLPTFDGRSDRRGRNGGGGSYGRLR